jgi:hypothetical protein
MSLKITAASFVVMIVVSFYLFGYLAGTNPDEKFVPFFTVDKVPVQEKLVQGFATVEVVDNIMLICVIAYAITTISVITMDYFKFKRLKVKMKEEAEHEP